MNCSICRTGVLRPGTTTVVLERGVSTIVLKAVPALVCDNCGEYYLESKAASRVLALAEQAVQRGSEVEVLHFAA